MLMVERATDRQKQCEIHFDSFEFQSLDFEGEKWKLGATVLGQHRAGVHGRHSFD